MPASGGRRAGVLGDDERGQPLAEVLVVDPDDGGVGHSGMLQEELLDLLWKHVLPARDDHVVVASVDEEAPGLVEVPDVAR